MKGITTIAALPGSGGGCISALPAEVVSTDEYEYEILINQDAIRHLKTGQLITGFDLLQLPADERRALLGRARLPTPADRQGFEPFNYTERS